MALIFGVERIGGIVFSKKDTGSRTLCYVGGTQVSYSEFLEKKKQMHKKISVREYRLSPYTYDQDAEVYGTVAEIRQMIRNTWSSEGDTWDVYVDKADDPTFRFVVGPRGGVRRENY